MIKSEILNTKKLLIDIKKFTKDLRIIKKKASRTIKIRNII